MRVGVTGADGLLGSTLVPLWRTAGDEVVAWTLADFDVTDGPAVLRAVRAAEPDVVVHAAAYTAVDRAETEPELVMRVNRDGAAHVAAACDAVGARCVYISTDYVFGGEAAAPIPADAPLRPAGVYARSKAEGERALAERRGMLIARSAWMFGPHGANFVDTMRRAAAEGRRVRVVNDQHGAPTSARLVAEVLWALVRGGASGVRHVVAAGATTWFEVARVVYAAAGADTGLVEPCTTAESGRAAPRPRYSVLDAAATVRDVGRPLPVWEDHVRSYVLTGVLPGLGLIGGADR